MTMLSSIGRAAVRKVVAEAPQSTNRAFQSIWHLQRVKRLQNVDNASAHPRLGFSFRRSYVTATKAAPKKKSTAKQGAAKPKAKKAAPKKVVKKAVKKKVVKKTKPKAKKVLTEQQKTRADVKKLKETALATPKRLPSTAWSVVLDEATRGSAGGPSSIGSAATTAAAKYKALTPAELEVSISLKE